MELKIYENILTMASMQSLRIACGLRLLDSGMLKRALNNSILKLSAVADDKVVGMLRVVGDCSFVFVICDVMVDPEYRNRGIATALVAYALRAIEEMLPKGVTGTVSLFASKGKEKLYSRLGFRELPDGMSGPGMQTMVIGRGDDL